jgi:hypothetical protein
LQAKAPSAFEIGIATARFSASSGFPDSHSLPTAWLNNFYLLFILNQPLAMKKYT